MVAILQLKASKLIVYFVSFTVVIFTILNNLCWYDYIYSSGPSYPVHLWQFILELLGDHNCKDFIAWTGNDLEFKVINSRELARRWGRRKNNARMNFDKLSRAMRYYYEKNIIKHIPGQRLVYRYCRNPDDIVFTQLLKTAMGTLPPETRLIAPVTTNPHFANAHSLSGSYGGLSGLANGPVTTNNTLMSSQFGNSILNQNSKLLTHSNSPINDPSSTQSSPIQPTLISSMTTLPASTSVRGLTTSPNSLPEYMFSSNLTQVQHHIQQSATPSDTIKHMMAS